MEGAAPIEIPRFNMDALRETANRRICRKGNDDRSYEKPHETGPDKRRDSRRVGAKSDIIVSLGLP